MTRLEAYAATATAIAGLAVARLLDRYARWCQRRAWVLRAQALDLRRDLETIARARGR